MNTTDIKRVAAEHVRVGDADGLARLVESVSLALGHVTGRASWMRGRQSKLKLLHEEEYQKENKKASDLEAQAKDYKALLADLKGLKVAIVEAPVVDPHASKKAAKAEAIKAAKLEKPLPAKPASEPAKGKKK